MQIDFKTLKKLPVKTGSGIFLGYIHDLQIQTQTQSINKYLVKKSSDIFKKEHLLISPNQIIQITPEAIIVSENLVGEKPVKEHQFTLNYQNEEYPTLSTNIEN